VLLAILVQERVFLRWIKISLAIGTEPMAEFHSGVFANIDFYLGPVAFVVADLFAGSREHHPHTPRGAANRELIK
jgi:hypothetical protein